MSESNDLGLDISFDFAQEKITQECRVRVVKTFALDRKNGVRVGCLGTVKSIGTTFGTKMYYVKLDFKNSAFQSLEILMPFLREQIEIYRPKGRKK